MQTASPPAHVCDGFEISVYLISVYLARSTGHGLKRESPPKAVGFQTVAPKQGETGGGCEISGDAGFYSL